MQGYVIIFNSEEEMKFRAHVQSFHIYQVGEILTEGGITCKYVGICYMLYLFNHLRHLKLYHTTKKQHRQFD